MTRTGFLRVSAFLLGLLLTLSINYHSFYTDFNLVPGDRGDTWLVVFTLEHWFNVFSGREAFYALNMFYPDRLALAYADGLLLFALPYALFRLSGLDYFTSYQLLFVFMTAFGYATCLLLLRKALRLDLAFSILGAVLLTSLNSMQFQAEIGKLLGFYFYPALIGLLYVYASTRNKSSWKASLSLACFATVLGLLFFTSYYPAWFFLFTLFLFGGVQFAAGSIRHGFGATLRTWVGFCRENWLQLLVSLGILIVSLIPFGRTYAPSCCPIQTEVSAWCLISHRHRGILSMSQT